jgi:hypothetical protein
LAGNAVLEPQYQSSLTVQPGSTVLGNVTVNDAPTRVVPGMTYTGQIVVSPS